ncbi:cilia- and flagella-associated protein 184 [Gastrophryne carolinensis]
MDPAKGSPVENGTSSLRADQDHETGGTFIDREPATTNQEPSTASANDREGTTSKQEPDMVTETNREGTTTNQEPGMVTETNREGTTTNQEPGMVTETNREGTTTNQEPGMVTETNREGETTNQEPGMVTETNREGTTTNQEPDTATASDHEGTSTNLEPGTTIATNPEGASTNQEPDTATSTNLVGATTNQELGTATATVQEGLNPNQEPGTTTVTEGEGATTNTEQSEMFPEEVVSSPGTLEPGVTPEEMINNTDEMDLAVHEDMTGQGQEQAHDDLVALQMEGSKTTEEQVQQQEEPEDENVREALIEQYQALVSDREKVHQQNSQLQHKLYEYFRKKKGEESRPETEKPGDDKEQRYLKYLATLEEMKRKYREDATCRQHQIEQLKAQCEQVVSQVDKEWAAFQEQKKKTALYVVNRSGGKHAASSLTLEIDQLQTREERKEKEVIQVRLENIKLKNQIHHYESTMRSKEELAEGLHLIDFEQLKIENQTYNEKIEERNEELLKLKKKITNTVQVLTHLKEKLQYVQAENQEQKEKLIDIEALVAQKRDILTKTKQARDSLRMDNLNLKQKCGLLGNKTLLRDFEDKVDTTEELHQKLENLKRHYAELTLSSKGIMKKIEEAKLVMEG